MEITTSTWASGLSWIDPLVSRRQILNLAILLTCPLPGAEEAAPVYGVNLEFSGNEQVSGANLRAALSALKTDLRRGGVDAGSADDAVYEVIRHYRSLGYRHARVSASWRRDQGNFTISFQVSEGPRSVLSDVALMGNSYFSTSELLPCFQWLNTIFFGLGARVFTEEVLQEGVDCIVSRYQQEGFYFAQASAAVSEDEAGKVRLHVEIREGPQVFLAEFPTLEGVDSFPLDLVRKACELEERPIYLPRLPLILKGKSLDFYKDRGYLFVDVAVEREIDPEKGEARLKFKVQEGPEVRIEVVYLDGNFRSYEWVLYNRVKLKSGDIYNEELVRASYRSLLRSGLFSSVTIETRRVEGVDDRVFLDVRVKEKARYKLALLSGYGSYELLRGAVVIEDTNLFGTGHRMYLEAKASFRGEAVIGSYVNPYFFDDRLSHTVQGEFERREQPSFVKQTQGGESGLSYRISDELRSSVVYHLRESDTLTVDENVPEELVENVLLSSVALSTIVDTRNSIVDPDHGFSTRATVEYAGGPLGSEIDFLRTTVFASLVVPIPFGFRLVGAGRAGAIARLAGTDVIPIQERFFNGGEYTVRSYRQDEAGDSVGGEPIGGETFTSLSLELRFPLLVLDGLQGAFFLDSGTLTQEMKDFGGGRYYFGLGSGLRYNTPVGPFRFDAAWNPDREKGEDEFVFHLGVGYPF